MAESPEDVNLKIIENIKKLIDDNEIDIDWNEPIDIENIKTQIVKNMFDESERRAGREIIDAAFKNGELKKYIEEKQLKQNTAASIIEAAAAASYLPQEETAATATASENLLESSGSPVAISAQSSETEPEVTQEPPSEVENQEAEDERPSSIIQLIQADIIQINWEAEASEENIKKQISEQMFNRQPEGEFKQNKEEIVRIVDEEFKKNDELKKFIEERRVKKQETRKAEIYESQPESDVVNLEDKRSVEARQRDIANSRLAALQAATKDLSQQHAEELRGRDSRIARQQAVIEQTKGELENTKATLESVRKENEQLNQENKNIGPLRTTIGNLTRDNTQLKGNLDASHAREEALEKQIVQLKREITTLQSNLKNQEALKLENDNLRTALTSAEEAKKAMDSALQVSEETRAKLEEERNKMRVDLAAAQKQQRGAAPAPSAALSELMPAVGPSEEELVNLRAQLDAANTARAAAEGRAIENESKAKELERLRPVENKVVEELDKAKAALKEANAAKGEAETARDAANAAAAAAELKVRQVEAQLRVLMPRYTETERRTTQANHLEQELEAVKQQKIKDAQALVEARQKIQKLEGQVAATEQKVNALQQPSTPKTPEESQKSKKFRDILTQLQKDNNEYIKMYGEGKKKQVARSGTLFLANTSLKYKNAQELKSRIEELLKSSEIKITEVSGLINTARVYDQKTMGAFSRSSQSKVKAMLDKADEQLSSLKPPSIQPNKPSNTKS